VPRITQVSAITKRLARSFRDSAEVVARWPENIPLVCCVSEGPENPWNRYSVFASPIATVTHDAKTHRTRIETSPGASAPAIEFSHDPVEDLRRTIASTVRTGSDECGDIPFSSGWIGFLSYELGRTIEPHAKRHADRECDRGWPLWTLCYCPGVLVHDRRENSWHVAGDSSCIPDLDGIASSPQASFECSPFVSSMGREAYERAVARTVDYTRAGDIFQANIAHRLTASFHGSTRAAFVRTLEVAHPWYGSCIEVPGTGRSIVSASPELFLRYDARTRAIVTRPIKGTIGGEHDAQTLLGSAKNAAELTMIVDLMRNDLGRVCEPGSVRVLEARELEQHAPGHPIFHTTATIDGIVRAGIDRAQIGRAHV